jgi:hypothetical protein
MTDTLSRCVVVSYADFLEHREWRRKTVAEPARQAPQRVVESAEAAFAKPSEQPVFRKHVFPAIDYLPEH